MLRQRVNKWKVERIDGKKDTFVHEIEIGDLDKDGVLEVYATPSEPNKLDAEAQRGEVVRYVPKKGEGPTIVADLGKRHAKEIYVGDVDGDGTDELYVAVEALTRGRGAGLEIVEPVEIRRYDADTPPDAKVIIATIPDRLCRFLTVGDVDGDGKEGNGRRFVQQGPVAATPRQEPEVRVGCGEHRPGLGRDSSTPLCSPIWTVTGRTSFTSQPTCRGSYAAMCGCAGGRSAR